MNFYEWIVESIRVEELKDNCPNFMCINPKKEKELKGKTFEQVKQEAAKYGLYLTWNNEFNIVYDTHTYIFSMEPLDEHGFPIKKHF